MSSTNRPTPRGDEGTVNKVEASTTTKQKTDSSKSESPKSLDHNPKIQPTAEQMRIAQIIDKSNDDPDFNDKVRQVMDLTQRSEDDVCIALHDCNNDADRAANMLLEGMDQGEWETSVKKKKSRPSGTNKTETAVNNRDAEHEDWNEKEANLERELTRMKGEGPPRMRGHGSLDNRGSGRVFDLDKPLAKMLLFGKDEGNMSSELEKVNKRLNVFDVRMKEVKDKSFKKMNESEGDLRTLVNGLDKEISDYEHSTELKFTDIQQKILELQQSFIREVDLINRSTDQTSRTGQDGTTNSRRVASTISAQPHTDNVKPGKGKRASNVGSGATNPVLPPVIHMDYMSIPKGSFVCVIDTNVWLRRLPELENVIVDYSVDSPKVLVPWRVITELDSLKESKTRPFSLSPKSNAKLSKLKHDMRSDGLDVAQSAQAAIKVIYEHMNKSNSSLRSQDGILNDLRYFSTMCGDHEILNCCLQQVFGDHYVIFISDDFNARNMVFAHHVHAYGSTVLLDLNRYRPLPWEKEACKALLNSELSERKRIMTEVWSFPSPNCSSRSNSSNPQSQVLTTSGLLVARGGEKRGFEAASAKYDMSLGVPQEYQSSADPKRTRLMDEYEADSTMGSEATNSSQSSLEDRVDSTEEEGQI